MLVVISDVMQINSGRGENFSLPWIEVRGRGLVEYILVRYSLRRDVVMTYCLWQKVSLWWLNVDSSYRIF